VINLKCTNCGAEAVKTEDFAVFDKPRPDSDIPRFAKNKGDDNVHIIGFIRFSLCRDCIKKGVKSSSSGNVVSAVGLGILGIVGMFLFWLLILQQGWSWWDWETIASIGFTAIVILYAFFFALPKAIIANKKKKRKHNEDFDNTPLSMLVSDDRYFSHDFDKFAYELLIDIHANNRDPHGKLPEEAKEFFRYYLPLGNLKEVLERKFKANFPPADLQQISLLYEQVKGEHR
jgi:hypothetical protein